MHFKVKAKAKAKAEVKEGKRVKELASKKGDMIDKYFIPPIFVPFGKKTFIFY